MKHVKRTISSENDDSIRKRTTQAQTFLQRMREDADLENKINDKIIALRKTYRNDAEADGKVLLFQSKCLRTAARVDRLDLVRKLIAVKDINVNEPGKSGATAVILSCKMGHTHIVREILEHPHVKINIKDCMGNTALIYSVQNKQLGAVQLLLYNIVKSLLEHEEIDVNIQDERGDTALMSAVDKGHKEIVKLIIGYSGLEPNEKHIRTSYG